LIRSLTLISTLCLVGCAHVPYFPTELAREGACGAIISEHEIEWYSRLLYAANEPSLLPLAQASTSEQVVRFLYLPSFEPQIVIRLNIPTTGPVRLTAKQIAGDGRYYPYIMNRNFSKRLSASQSARVRDLVAAARLPQIPSNGCEGPGMDGDTWIIESVQAEQYHYINRWVPGQGEVRTFGTELARLVGWQGNLRRE